MEATRSLSQLRRLTYFGGMPRTAKIVSGDPMAPMVERTMDTMEKVLKYIVESITRLVRDGVTRRWIGHETKRRIWIGLPNSEDGS